MSVTDFRRETDADLETPPMDAAFEPAAPLKDTGVSFTPAEQDFGADGEALSTDSDVTDAMPESFGENFGESVGTRQALRDGGTKLTSQATDKARMFADQGKAKAGETLDQFAQMLTDAAGTVDEKVGGRYGQYARSAADQVTSFSNSLKAKDVDELVDDVRGFVRASPAAAIGIAAALGFALARLVQSGLEADADNRKA